MQIFLRILLIIIFFCSAFFINHYSSTYNKIISNSYSYISETKHKTILSVNTEKSFISAIRQNRIEINNPSSKNNNLGAPLGNTVFNQLNIFNKFVIYKNKLSFKYLLYRILNNLRNSIYPNAP